MRLYRAAKAGEGQESLKRMQMRMVGGWGKMWWDVFSFWKILWDVFFFGWREMCFLVVLFFFHQHGPEKNHTWPKLRAFPTKSCSIFCWFPAEKIVYTFSVWCVKSNYQLKKVTGSPKGILKVCCVCVSVDGHRTSCKHIFVNVSISIHIMNVCVCIYLFHSF